jgi:hypothetical protein
MSGDVVMWEQNIRLRHMCTRKYLALNKGASEGTQWQLTKDPTDKAAIFRLHRVVRDESLEVNFESYARIQHVASGMWLHGTEDPYRLRQYDIAATSDDPMDKLEWDGARLRRLASSKEARYDDAFALVPVPDAYWLNFNFVAGLVRPIEIFVRRAQVGTRSGSEALSAYHYNVRERM